MTGIGLVATVPMFGIGAPLTIGGALQRIYYQEKEKSFRGKNSEFTDEKISEISPISLFTKFFRSASGDDLDKKVLGELDEKFCELTDNLAKVKSLSLLHQMVNCTKDRERKIAFLKEPAKKTGLEKVVLEKVKDFYQNNEEQFKSFLDLSAQEANCKIAKGILTVLDTSAAKLGFEEEVPDQEMSKLASRKLITAAKNSLKSARFFAADAIVRVGQTIQARKDLELTPEEIAPSNNKTPFAQDASHYHDGKACEGDHKETFLETQFCAPVPKKKPKLKIEEKIIKSPLPSVNKTLAVQLVLRSNFVKTESVFFENKNGRGNKLRTIHQEKGSQIYNYSSLRESLKEVINLAASECGVKEFLKEIIDYARKFGGFSNKFNGAVGQEGSYSKGEQDLQKYIQEKFKCDENQAQETAKKWRRFSKIVQEKNSQIGIYSGRSENAKSPLVGLRSSFALDIVGDQILAEEFDLNSLKKGFENKASRVHEIILKKAKINDSNYR